MPEWSEIVRLISLSDYNTRVVLFGCVALGIAAGMIGPFMMLRRRALMAIAIRGTAGYCDRLSLFRDLWHGH